MTADDHSALQVARGLLAPQARPDSPASIVGRVDGHSFELNDDARRALELLNAQGAVTVVELRAAGVSMPAQALYSLQLAGWPVQRNGSSWRLIDSDEPAPVREEPPPRVRRVTRELPDR